MNKIEKYEAVKDWASTAFESEEEFCIFFGVSLEDLLERFPDLMIAAYAKVFPPETGEEEDDDIPPWEDVFQDENE